MEGIGGTIGGILAKAGIASASASTIIGIVVGLLVADLSLLQTDITKFDKGNGVTLHFSTVGWVAGGGLVGVTATLAVEDMCGQGGNALTCGLWITGN